jgi:predicted transcriptional regulator
MLETSTRSTVPRDAAPKQRALELVRQLDDDVEYGEILYRLHLLQQVEQGLEDVEQGNTVSHDEVEDQIDEWLN